MGVGRGGMVRNEVLRQLMSNPSMTTTVRKILYFLRQIVSSIVVLITSVCPKFRIGVENI